MSPSPPFPDELEEENDTRTIPFGTVVRSRRLAQGIGLRELAREVDITPTYLSKIERSVFPPPRAEKIVAIAVRLGLNSDELLAAAGKIAADVRAVVLHRPAEFAELLRALQTTTRTKLRALMSSLADD